MRFVFKTSYNADIRLFKHKTQAAWYGFLLVLLIALPFILSDFIIGEITGVFIWAICGMGIMLLVGHTGQASLGHAAFMAIGAYSTALYQIHFSLPFVPAIILGGLTSGLAGMLIALPITRLHGIYMAIATLAISVLAEDIIVLAEPLTGGVSGLFTPEIEIFGINFNRYGNPIGLYFLILIITLIIIFLYKNILRSSLGRAFAAVRDSEISAKAMGINIAFTKALSFGLSCTITGIGGALMGYFTGIFNHETFNVVMSIYLLMMIVIGGLGTIHGAFFGAMVVGFLPLMISFGRDAFQKIFDLQTSVIPGIEFGIFGMILISFILFEPTGIYGRWIKIRTYFELFPFYRKDMFKRQKSYLKTERTQ